MLLNLKHKKKVYTVIVPIDLMNDYEVHIGYSKMLPGTSTTDAFAPFFQIQFLK